MVFSFVLALYATFQIIQTINSINEYQRSILEFAFSYLCLIPMTFHDGRDVFSYRNCLLNSPLFAKRKNSIRVLQNNFVAPNRIITFSIIVATYERAACLKRVFNHLIQNRPNNTEIIISDDASMSAHQISFLNEIAEKHQNDDVYVIQHNHSFGAFHTKLDGFLFSVGDFIMSIDDDDIFDDKYYIEMAETTIKHLSQNPNLNFIIALDFPYIKKWVKLPVLLKEMISSFHNHVDFAFRRSLLSSVDYPPHEVRIVRDDAPLMIPLYIQANDSQVLYYNNTYKYLVDKRCPASQHQTNMYLTKKQFYLNGYKFLCRYLEKINRSDLFPTVKSAYQV